MKLETEIVLRSIYSALKIKEAAAATRADAAQAEAFGIAARIVSDALGGNPPAIILFHNEEECAANSGDVLTWAVEEWEDRMPNEEAVHVFATCFDGPTMFAAFVTGEQEESGDIPILSHGIFQTREEADAALVEWRVSRIAAG